MQKKGQRKARADRPTSESKPLIQRQQPPLFDGVAIRSSDAALTVVGSRGDEQRIEPDEVALFHPTPVISPESPPQEIPGFRPPLPSFVLWLAIVPEADTIVAIDTSGLNQNSARWGRPMTMVSISPAETGSWNIIERGATIEAGAGSLIRLVSIGYGVAIDPASIFPSLVAAIGHRARSIKKEKPDAE